MPITTNDIKLMKSERMTDDADGGGRMSGNEVIDGLSNNTFPDISTFDRINGRVSLRKVSVALLTDDTESLLGAHTIISELPTDPNVSVALFNSGSHTDERDDVLQSMQIIGYQSTASGGHTITASDGAAKTVTVSDAAPVVGGIYYLVTDGPANNFAIVESVTGTGPWTATLADLVPNVAGGTLFSGGQTVTFFAPATCRAAFYGASPLSATVSSGSTLQVDTVNERISPKYDGVDQDEIGFDPSRHVDGRAPIFAPGYKVALHHTAEDTLPNPLSAGQTVALSRADLRLVQLVDQDGDYVATDKYTVDLVAGEVTMATPLDLSAYTEPLIARHRIEQMFRLTAVNNATRELSLAGAVSRSFPANESIVSSAVNLKDLKARVYNLFDQQTWTDVWSDGVIGSPAPATYNHVTHPITITNRGAIQERWAVVFTSATAFKVVGETLGQIAVGDTSTVCEPINPNTGVPYFSIPATGWGIGWSTGNAVRFSTASASGPFWEIRCVNLGDPTASDQFTVEPRGDINV